MKNEQKLKKLRQFLAKNNVRYCENFYNSRYGIVADLAVPSLYIVVNVTKGKDEDDMYFQQVKYLYRPLFIRDEDTVDFVIEKMTNLLVETMNRSQKAYVKRLKRKVMNERRTGV